MHAFFKYGLLYGALIASGIVTPPPDPTSNDGGWKKLGLFAARIAAMPGLGASAADTVYTGVARSIDVYVDTINGSDTYDGTQPFRVGSTSVGPKKTLMPNAPARTSFGAGKKYGILAGSTFNYTFQGASPGAGPVLVTAANASFVGIARTTAAAITTGPVRQRRNARTAGQELQPLRNQFDIGRLCQWIDDSDKAEWFFFCYGDSPLSTNLTSANGHLFNVGVQSGFVLRNCWEEGFRGGIVQCDVGFTIEDCYGDNNYNINCPAGDKPSGWFIRSYAMDQPGLRIVGCWCGGNIGEDMIWNQQSQSGNTGSGFYDFQIKDCCLRHWCVAQTIGDSEQHCDWWQGGGHPGAFLIQRVVGEHVIRETLHTSGSLPIGQGFLTNNTGSVSRGGGTMRDFIMYSNGVVINENHIGTSDATLTRDHVAFCQSLNPAFNSKTVICVNLNQTRTYNDTACKVWFDGKKSNDADGTAAELSSRTAGQWSTT